MTKNTRTKHTTCGNFKANKPIHQFYNKFTLFECILCFNIISISHNLKLPLVLRILFY